MIRQIRCYKYEVRGICFWTRISPIKRISLSSLKPKIRVIRQIRCYKYEVRGICFWTRISPIERISLSALKPKIRVIRQIRFLTLNTDLTD